MEPKCELNLTGVPAKVGRVVELLEALLEVQRRVVCTGILGVTPEQVIEDARRRDW